MTTIKLKNVSHVYTEEVEAVKNVNWVIPDGYATGLLGPSGCGKTTLMKIISGLLRQTKGSVFFNGQEVTDLTPQERNVCMVFQFPVVYPDMTVYDNLAFPLRNMKVPKEEIKKKVEETAEFLGLASITQKLGRSLNMADKQLVSLGRAIIRENPNVIMLDEPLTNVEPERRFDLRRTLKIVQKEMKHTMIYVTHDQTEALTFSDKIAVMQGGEILQYAGKDELYENPVNPFVGYFIGSPGMNFIDCSLSKEGLDFGEFTLKISKKVKDVLEKNDTKFKVGIRPENVEISTTKREEWLRFNSDFVEFQGIKDVVTLRKGGILINVVVPSEKFKISKGDDVWVHFLENKIKIYNSKDILII